MPYAVLQKDLAAPRVDQLERAFRHVKGLTALDAHTLGQDAFGILVKGFSAEDAAALQGALRVEGVETEIVEQSVLPVLPPTKNVTRLDCCPEHLRVYDPLGRSFALEWGHVSMIAAGAVRLVEFNEVTKRVPVEGADGSYEVVVERSTREERNYHWLAEIILTRGVQRFSLSGDRFNFTYLGERRSRGVLGNFRLLLQDLMRFAPHAAINRGAYYFREDAPETLTYPSKGAFLEEILWLLWRLKEKG